MGRPPHQPAPDTPSGVIVVSQRDRADGCGRQPGYVPFHEAEDVLVDATGADLTLITAAPSEALARVRRAAGRTYRRLTSSNDALPRIPLTGRAGLPRRSASPLRDHYDLGVFVGYSVWDLHLIEPLYDLRDRCEELAAWLPEVWPAELDDRRLTLEPFALADHLFVGMADSATALSRLLGRPVHYLPMAVDAVRFAAPDPTEARPLDVLGIGRRLPRLHEALLDWSRKTSRLYVYDTLSGLRANDMQAHRENLADTYRRTNVAITHFAKFDDPISKGQREIPGRLWEGLASGALMVGLPPHESLQRLWPGQPVVVELPADPSAGVDLIDEMIRCDSHGVRRRNVELALTGNDWGHRWQQIFHATGLAVPAGLTSRVDHLASLAASINI